METQHKHEIENTTHALRFVIKTVRPKNDRNDRELSSTAMDPIEAWWLTGHLNEGWRTTATLRLYAVANTYKVSPY